MTSSFVTVQHGSCEGDEGGPLIQGNGLDARVVGIFSYNNGCENGPGIYSRLSSYVEWITSIAG